ncbi:MAG: TRAP transporter large permease [Proteobacteria bacterium]|nr:TRAP transporter large permease [Pseudomonadota bacterium]
MSGPLLGLVVILVMIGLMAFRVPIAISMFLAGAGGYVAIAGWLPLLGFLKSSPYATFSSYSLSVVPLFLLMGHLATHAGLSRAIFRAANALFGSMRGGLSIATIGGCAMFGAICGSSLATAATMGKVALPEMKRFKYSGSLATGSLAAGGTLGILIPPSVVLVIYAIITEQNVAKMFLAAFIPGILAAAGYMVAVAVYVRIYPESGPAGERVSGKELFQALMGALPAALLFIIVIGGIYAGVFTPTEAAAFGVVGTGLIAWKNGITWSQIAESLTGTAVSTGMIYMILLGASIFSAFLTQTQLPQTLAEIIGNSGYSPMMVLTLILVMYLILGCVMESLSMILLTIPIFFPIIQILDFGLSPEETAIWFGILALIVVEVGLITPPVGLIVFIINKMAVDVPIGDTFRGILPFLISDIIRVIILIAFPVLTLFLVRVFQT